MSCPKIGQRFCKSNRTNSEGKWFHHEVADQVDLGERLGDHVQWFCDNYGCKKSIIVLSGLWQMFRTFVLRCDWSILRILKLTKKHERQSERVTLVSIYNNILIHGLLSLLGEKIFKVTPISI